MLFFKLFLAVLRKCGLVTIELGRDYDWYNLLSLFNIWISLGFVLLVFVLDDYLFYVYDYRKSFVRGYIIRCFISF